MRRPSPPKKWPRLVGLVAVVALVLTLRRHRPFLFLIADRGGPRSESWPRCRSSAGTCA